MPSRSLTPVLLTGLLAAVTGCGAGQDPEVYRERATVDAALASVGQLELRNVRIEPPARGGDELTSEATASLAVVNTGTRADELVSVSTPAATTVDLLDADGADLDTVPVPPRAALGNTDLRIALRTLTAPLRPGQTIEMTFVFRDNGRRTLQVPVGVYTEPAPAPTANPFEPHEEGETGKVAGETEG